MSQAIFESGALGGRKVLVAEDSADAREVLVDFLSMCGLDVTAAASGWEALARFKEVRPEVIVSDVWMPNGNGLELIKAVRTLPPEAGGLTPAIAVSAAATVEQCLEAGFHFHLQKPFDPMKLLDTIRDFLDGAGDAGRAHWTLASHEGAMLLTFDGHVTSADMRAAVASLVTVLHAGPTRLIVDLRALTGFDPSVTSVAQRTVWPVRANLTGVEVRGGSWLARAMSRTACMLLGVPCETIDT